MTRCGNLSKMNKEDLKIVFLGTPDFAVPSLDALMQEGFNIVGVITMPDKPAGRGHQLLHSPVKKYALAHGLKLLQPANLKDPDFVEELRSLEADLFIVIAFRMLPEVVWQMPRLGTFNLHASLLPKYRGAAPINWAIMNGDTRTGVTTFFLKHEIDTGDILRQEAIEIGPDENLESVHDRLMTLGAELTLDTVRHIIAGDLKPQPQDELLQGAAPTPAPKIFKDTCRIDWSRPAADIHNHVRGLSPYPAAWSEINGSTAKILRTARLQETRPGNLNPGQCVIKNGRLLVATGDNMIEILELQPQGKRPMAASAFLNGLRNDPTFS